MVKIIAQPGPFCQTLSADWVCVKKATVPHKADFAILHKAYLGRRGKPIHIVKWCKMANYGFIALDV